MAEPARRRMTPDEFFAWQVTQEELYELVDGVPVLPAKAMTGATKRHDLVVVNAIIALGTKLRGGPCRPMTDDIASMMSNANIRRPDLTVECGEFDERSTRSAGPVLVLEVLSPSTETIDRFVKLEEYKALPSLRHILIASPTTPHVIHYSRADERDAWSALSHIGLDSTIGLPAIGCSLALSELYEGAPTA